MVLMLGYAGIEYVFTPVYSPTMNPVELCFNHIKTLLRSPELRVVAQDNLHMHFAIMTAVNRITPSDCAGYYRHVDYSRM